MAPRTTTLAVSAVLLAALVSVLSFLPVPYARLSPGPTTDTLGSVGGTPLIRIDGTRTYETDGQLELTTVSISSPGHRMGLFEAFTGWFRSGVAVVPRENVYPEDQTPEQITQRNVREMELSQQHATFAALNELDIPVDSYVLVAGIVDGTPAQGTLQLADRITRIDGDKVSDPADVARLVARAEPGDEVVFTVRRDGERRRIPVTTTESPDDPGVPFVGIRADRGYDFPFLVDIRLDDVGGPSAGLMFALGIVDKLNPESVTGGRVIAGTGTISDSGQVGPIGGIGMKIRGARNSGASAFLVPAENCRAAVSGAPEGITLIRVDSLSTALDALETLRTGGESVPTC